MVISDDRRIPVEELIDFPTEYSFKAIGHHTREFAKAVHIAVARALADDRPVALRTRLSAKGAYISATCTSRIESAEELASVYAGLRKVPGVITVL